MMTEWRPFRFPRDRHATGVMYWPASEEGPERYSFGYAWDNWATFDTPPSHWIPCPKPGTPISRLQWLRLQPERFAYWIWPHMDTGFLEWHIGGFIDRLYATWWWLTDPSYRRMIALRKLDEEIP